MCGHGVACVGIRDTDACLRDPRAIAAGAQRARTSAARRGEHVVDPPLRARRVPSVRQHRLARPPEHRVRATPARRCRTHGSYRPPPTHSRCLGRATSSRPSPRTHSHRRPAKPPPHCTSRSWGPCVACERGGSPTVPADTLTLWHRRQLYAAAVRGSMTATLDGRGTRISPAALRLTGRLPKQSMLSPGQGRNPPSTPEILF